MLSVTFSATLEGARGSVVQLQAATENALPQICLTGLPNTVIRESRERVRACLVQHGFEIPSRRIVVNLSPACTPKQGSQLDLAIALSCLAAEQKLDVRALDGVGVLGELTLDGKLRAVPHALPLLEALEKCDSIHTIIVPKENAKQASMLGSKKARLAGDLDEVMLFLQKKLELKGPEADMPESLSSHLCASETGGLFDSIVGHSAAKFALQVALAGRHHLLLIGPPGVGKSLLAQAARELLPRLRKEEQVELMRIYSLGNLEAPVCRPFRSPHHSASAASVLGGGNQKVSPGDVSYAHTGILFLDELPEFRKDLLEGLREPLEAREVHIRRVDHAETLPADFTLIAAMNPCPCGHAFSSRGRCTCSLGTRTQYLKRISGPLADRFDLMMVLSRPLLARPEGGEAQMLTAERARKNIAWAWECRKRRREEKSARNDTVVDSFGVTLSPEDEAWFRDEVDESGMSLRRARKWVQVARTIAELASAPPDDGEDFPGSEEPDKHDERDELAAKRRNNKRHQTLDVPVRRAHLLQAQALAAQSLVSQPMP